MLTLEQVMGGSNHKPKSRRFAVCKGRRLTLDFGLKAPGAGILEFDVERLRTEDTRVTVTAYWHPQGVWGLLYWAMLVPFHLFIFKGMTRAIAHRAEALDASGAGLDKA